MTTTRGRASRVAEYVTGRVERLQQRYRANTSAGAAELSRLRRGVGTPLGADLELLGIALADADASLFDSIGAPSDDPTPEEHAAYAAITLFALHQQSKREVSLHRRGYSMGRSARLLSARLDRDSTRQRFAALGTATTWEETVHHARGLIQQFRQHDIPLDYGQFARDLFELRIGDANHVRTRWGRDYYRLGDPADTPADTLEHTPDPPRVTSRATEGAETP